MAKNVFSLLSKKNKKSDILQCKMYPLNEMHGYYLIYVGLLSNKNRNRIPSFPSAPNTLAHYCDKVCDYRCQESGGCEVQYIGRICPINER